MSQRVKINTWYDLSSSYYRVVQTSVLKQVFRHSYRDILVEIHQSHRCGTWQKGHVSQCHGDNTFLFSCLRRASIKPVKFSKGKFDSSQLRSWYPQITFRWFTSIRHNPWGRLWNQFHWTFKPWTCKFSKGSLNVLLWGSFLSAEVGNKKTTEG
jgi:hypothetical protein